MKHGTQDKYASAEGWLTMLKTIFLAALLIATATSPAMAADGFDDLCVAAMSFDLNTEEEVPEAEEDDIDFAQIGPSSAALIRFTIDRPGALEIDAGGAEFVALLEGARRTGQVSSTAVVASRVLSVIDPGDYQLCFKVSRHAPAGAVLRVRYFPACDTAAGSGSGSTCTGEIELSMAR